MKTLTIILTCCHSLQQTAVCAISNVCWGVILLLAFYFLLRYIFSPLIANCHERSLKEQDFEHEGTRIELKQCKSDKSRLEKEKGDLKQAFEDSGKSESTLRKEILAGIENDKKAAEKEKELLKEQIEALKGIIKSLGK